jgi:hypothetical protein
LAEETEVLGENLPSATRSPQIGKPASNRLSYGIALPEVLNIRLTEIVPREAYKADCFFLDYEVFSELRNSLLHSGGRQGKRDGLEKRAFIKTECCNTDSRRTKYIKRQNWSCA